MHRDVWYGCVSSPENKSKTIQPNYFHRNFSSIANCECGGREKNSHWSHIFNRTNFMAMHTLRVNWEQSKEKSNLIRSKLFAWKSLIKIMCHDNGERRAQYTDAQLCCFSSATKIKIKIKKKSPALSNISPTSAAGTATYKAHTNTCYIEKKSLFIFICCRF